MDPNSCDPSIISRLSKELNFPIKGKQEFEILNTKLNEKESSYDDDYTSSFVSFILCEKLYVQVLPAIYP